MDFLAMCENTTSFIDEEPNYLYIGLNHDKYIPTKEQVTQIMKKYGVVDKIKYDLSKYGVPNGIYVYFDYFDMKYNNTQLLLSEIKYAGSCQITIPFVNSLRSIDYNYDLYASKRIVNFDINNIEKPTLRRSRNVPYLNFHEMNETIQDLREDVMNLQYAC
jgi:hypothetical protein